jgi:hypothetical protein
MNRAGRDNAGLYSIVALRLGLLMLSIGSFYTHLSVQYTASSLVLSSHRVARFAPSICFCSVTSIGAVERRWHIAAGMFPNSPRCHTAPAPNNNAATEITSPLRSISARTPHLHLRTFYFRTWLTALPYLAHARRHTHALTSARYTTACLLESPR